MQKMMLSILLYFLHHYDYPQWMTLFYPLQGLKFFDQNVTHAVKMRPFYCLCTLSKLSSWY